MLSVLNLYSHGYVAVPVLGVCRRRGLFERLRSEHGVQTAALPYGANSGYLKIALRMLESLGWVLQPASGTYVLTSDAAPEQIPDEICELYQYPVEELLTSIRARELLRHFLLYLADEQLSVSAQVRVLLEGAVYLPLLIALRPLAGDGAPLAQLDAATRAVVAALFVRKDWGIDSGAGFELTPVGRQVLEHAYVMGLPASYRPMLSQIEELLFGNPARVFQIDPILGERQIDRKLNVLASGFQRERYFHEFEGRIVEIFNRLPIDAQPRYIANMGCGDGAFLKQIYAVIQNRTERGKHLREAPLRLIGIDHHRAALAEAERTLAGLSPLLLAGEINDPDRLMRDLRALGINDLDRILHVRAFLDHKFRYIPDNISGGARTIALSSSGVDVDATGAGIEPQALLRAWEQHLARWAHVITSHGLLILESHCLSAQITRKNFSDTESFSFDTLHSLSGQHLIDADCFLMLAAGVGLFPKVPPTRYPRTLPFCQTTLCHFEKRDYIIRPAEPKDLDALFLIEHACWPDGLRVSREEIGERLAKYPEGQFLLEYREPQPLVAGVLYTQRITDAAILQTRTFRDVFALHQADGQVVQLLSINILPKMQEYELGDQLLEFALERCSVINGVTTCVGVTRCKGYEHQREHAFPDYVRLCASQGSLVDPVLRFHQRHGAIIEGPVAGYRPEDSANEGYGVLVRYDLLNRQRQDRGGSNAPVPAGPRLFGSSAARPTSAQPTFFTAEFLEALIRRFLGPSREHGFAPDRPLMEMGLDSADLLELNAQLGAAYDVKLESAFFFQQNTADKVARYLDRHASVRQDQGPATSDIAPGAAWAESAVAIVGIACRLPGGINKLDELGTLLQQGGSAIGPLPVGRLSWPPEVKINGDQRGIDRGGFLRDVDCFDASFFRISPKEAESMDPQQRILLELAWETLEDAGYSAERLAGTDTSVFIGASGSDYSRLLDRPELSPSAHFGTGASVAVLANRISYFFDFKGPSIELDTACSSSLVALHQALHALSAKETSLALVGGINLICHPANSLTYHKAGMLSKEGLCKTFDKRADGYVRAEGAVMILVKPLTQALRDQNRIHAIIRGSAINHGGQASGLTVPNPEQQAQLLAAAWRNAGVHPSTIAYIEAHGTGTSLGDPIEVRGLKDAFSSFAADEKVAPGTCGLGSIKSNLGHLEAAAGLAGLLKLVLSLAHRELFATRNFHELNPHIDLRESPLYIVNQRMPWPDAAHPRRCGVSSFGSGGSNAHVLLEEFRAAPRQAGLARGPHLFVVSARDDERLRAYVAAIHHWLQTHDVSPETLADLVYTFQIGRKAMDERLALVVATGQELRSRLEQYLHRQPNIPDCYHDNIRHHRSSLNTLVDGKDAGQLGQQALASGDLRELARLWVLGSKLDWHLLHPRANHAPRLIAAPTYPFARDRHWLPAPPAQAGLIAPLHPLIDRNDSTLQEHKYQKLFDAKSFYLKDHVVHGHVILPGVAHLEMARAAAQHATKEPVHGLRDIMWGRPLLVDDGPTAAVISIAAQHGELAYAILRDDTGTQEQSFIYSQGVLEAERPPPQDPQRFDLEALRARCTVHKGKAEVDAHLRQLGFGYGPTFQVIEELYAGPEEALVRLQLPDSLRAERSAFTWHPALLDAAVRACFLIGMGHNALNDTLRIPFSLAALRVFTVLPEACFSYARLVRKQQDGDYVADISIVAGDGRELACFKDFCFRRFKELPTSASVKGHPQARWFYRPTWEPAPKSPFSVQPRGRSAPRILLIDLRGARNSELRQELANSLDLANAQLYYAYPGAEYQALAAGYFQIDLEQGSDWRRLLSTLAQEGNRPTDIVVLASPSPASPFGSNTAAPASALSPALHTGLYALFHLIQALLHQTSREPLRILVCSESSAQTVPVHAAMAGLAKAMPGILPAVSVVTLRIECLVGSETLLARTLAWELLHPGPSGTEIRYQTGERLVRKLRPLDDAERQHAAPLFRPRGTYVITGGLGGLGIRLAAYLAAEYQAKLILIGRSELGLGHRDTLAELGQRAAHVSYLRVDVTDQRALAGALQEARQRVGALHGILHCAGSAGAPFDERTTLSSFEQGLWAKVAGAVNLDVLTQEDPLELFVLFSSVAALLGDFGRGNYAAANRFLDEFAEWRSGLVAQRLRFGKSLSINWPYWEDGGFGKEFFRSEAGEAFYFEHGGFAPLKTIDAMAALERALLSPDSQVVVATGQRAKVERTLEVITQSASTAPQVLVPEPSVRMAQKSPAQTDELLPLTIAYLTELVAQATGTAAHKIASGDDLGSYGIDSMLVMGMHSRLREDFGPLPGTLFFEHNTIGGLAGYFLANQETKLRQRFAAALANRFSAPAASAPPRFVSQPAEQRSHEGLSTPAPAVEAVEERQVAIIGMSGRYPQARNLEEFWQNLRSGRDCIEEIPRERWDARSYYREKDPKPGQTNSKWGGFIADVDRFDPLFFNILPREAHYMDPQQRLFAEVAWEACEDAGYRWDRFNNRAELPKENNVGVFLGTMYSDYPFFEGAVSTSYFNSFIANRISYFFNFRGPSITLDTACSSSLTALYLAYESVRRGDSYAAIAGGTNLSIHPKKYTRLSELHLLSSEGKCKSFGAGGSGYVPGEGIGALLLKSLSDAVRDGDRIYGVIRGGALNHGGKTNGFTVPNPNAQANLILAALRDARVDPRHISYIEAHGTGTSLGDPIEIAGLTRAFRKHTQDKQFCAIASVKSNVGHLEGAAGIVAVSKVLLQMQHGVLVRSLHCETLNPLIDFANSPFRVQQELAEWKRPRIAQNGEERELPRLAGVSSFGAGGSNAHILIEEYRPSVPRSPLEVQAASAPGPWLVPLSAKTPERLRDYTEKLLLFLERSRQGQESVERAAKAVSPEATLRALLAAALRVDPVELDSLERFSDCGIDRIVLTAVLAGLEKELAVDLPTSKLAASESLHELMSQLTLHLARHPRVPASRQREAADEAPAVQREPAGLKLADLCYTLQVGREAMEERVGFLVSSLEDLEARLRDYLQADAAPRNGHEPRASAGIFQETLKSNRDTLRAFLNEEDLGGLLDSWLAGGQYAKILNAWVKGLQIDWQRLYTGRALPRRISLPAYPFARERYWVLEPAAPVPAEPAGPHPLLSRNVSSFARQCFISRFSGQEFFLSDHRVADRKLLPGVAFLELARAGGALAQERPVTAIRNMIWAQPIVVAESPVEVSCSLFTTADGVRFEVSSQLSAQEDVRYAQGLLCFSPLAEAQPARNLAAIRSRCQTHLSGVDCYAAFRDFGFAYGPSFTCVQDIWRGEGESLSRIEVSADSATTVVPFVLPPGLLDSTLQATLLFAEEAAANHSLYIPFSLVAFELHRPLTRRAYSHVVLKDSKVAADFAERRFDVEILDEQGTLLAKFVDLALRAAKKKSPQSARGYFRNHWSLAPLEAEQPSLLDGGPLLLFDAAAADSSTWKHPALPQIIHVRPAKSFRELGRTVYEIDPGSRQDYQQLLLRLAAHGIVPAYVVHALSLPRAAESSLCTAELLESSLYAMFHLCQALIESKREKKLHLLYLYPEQHADSEPLYAAMGGFARSLNQENPTLFCKTVALVDWAQRAQAVAFELQPENLLQRNVEVRRQARVRAVMDLQRISAMPAPEAAIRKHGVYLITGGGGGLGLSFASFLVQSHQANVVLCGRAPLSPDKQAALHKLSAQGGELSYVRADVTDPAAVTELVADIKRRYGALHGILHSAGVVRNSYVLSKTPSEIADVLAAKVYGTICLDVATQSDVLDFFVLFSSISAVVDIVGQSDYSFANRFLDHFAAWRERQRAAGQRHGKTISINWPLWKDGGMTVDVASQRFLEASMGMTPFLSQSGPEVLLRGLALNESQLMVADGDLAKIERFVIKQPTVAPLVRQIDMTRSAPAPAGTADVFAQFQRLIWRKVAEFLQVDQGSVGIDTSLMDFGVDSISSMKFINQLNKDFDLILSPAVLFEFSTVAALSRHLYEQHGDALRRRLSLGDSSAVAPPTLAARAAAIPPRPETLPLSRGQQALWFLHQLAPSSPAYHIALTFRIRSLLDVAAFRHSWTMLSDRHPLLRARIVVQQGTPLYEIQPSQEPSFELCDVAHLTTEELQSELRVRYRQPFDLEKGPLLRIHLLRRTEQDYVCLLTIHHVVADAWSVWVLMREFGELYDARKESRAASLAASPPALADYLGFCESLLASPQGQRQWEYWQRQLAGEAAILNLPTDRPRPKSQTFQGASIPFSLSSDLYDRLARLAREQRVTPFMLFLAAYQVLLHRYSGDDIVRVGSPMSGRSNERFYDIVGCFINPVVLQADLGQNPAFAAFLAAVRDTVLRALENQDFPFPVLVERLNPERPPGASPLFQAEFVFQNTHRRDDLLGLLAHEEGFKVQLGSLALHSFPFSQQEGQFDLTLELAEIGSSISGALKYNTELFEDSSVSRMVSHFIVLLEGIAANPFASVRSYSLLSPDEQLRMTSEWNQTPAAHPLTTPAHRLFERQAAAHAGRTAIQFHTQALSYRELNERSNRLARYLQGLGIGPGTLAAVCVPRSLEMVTAILGVLKTGAAYVPMDPAYPPARLSHMLEHSQAKVLLGLRGAAGQLRPGDRHVIDLAADWDKMAELDGTDLAVAVDPESPAYVIYTSGSTGTPKGVVVPHRALTNFLCSMQNKLGYRESDRMLAVTTISFDISAMELFLPLSSGAMVVVADSDTAADGAALQRLLLAQKITTMQATPATWQLLLASGWQGSRSLTIYCGGEALPRSLAQELLARSAAVWNLYGPTETTIWSAGAAVSATAHPRLVTEPLGRPIDNTSLYILDDALGAVPPGVIGDLYIGGVGLAVGYLHQPELTAERFLPNPFGPGRIYKTGDRARYLSNGDIEFVGRSDAQVKLRGFRIELGEVESALRKQREVADCVAVLRQDGGSDKTLVAYVVPRPGSTVQPREMRTSLRRLLPEYMIPAAIVTLEALPLTPNNKVDRKALPKPERESLAVESRATPPSSTLETQLLNLWTEVLRHQGIGIHDRFFDIGGNSMLAAKLILRIRETFAVHLPVSILFEHSTVAALARSLDELMRQAQTESRSAEEERLLSIFERIRNEELDVETAKHLLGVSP